MGTIRIESKGRVLLATIQSPPHGLMDSGVVDALDALVARADGDPGVGAVVLTGDHPSRFLAHFDVSELLEGARTSPTVGRHAAAASLRAIGSLRRVGAIEQALSGTQLAGLVLLERFHDIFLRMNRSGAVYVAALNGSAMGGGCELALACDRRLMAAGDFMIGQPEILFGFPPGGGGTQRLTRLLGTAGALRIVLDGAPLDPQAAAELGIIDEVVPAEGLADRALEVATELAGRSKTAVGAAKRAVYEGGSLGLAAGLRRERAEFVAALGTPEAEAAMAAYVAGMQRTGDLPGYDREALAAAVAAGRFA